MLHDPRFQPRQRIDQGELRGVALDLALGDAGGVTRCDRARHVLSAVCGWNVAGTAVGRPCSRMRKPCRRQTVTFYLRAMHIRNVGMLPNTSACQIPTAFDIMVPIRDA